MPDSHVAAALPDAVEAALARIPPLWPLAAAVAVNPFLGQADDDLATASARLERVAGERATPPRSLQAERLSRGEVTDDDLAAALAEAPLPGLDVAGLRNAAHEPVSAPRALPTVAELAAEASGIDWPGIVDERIGLWAAGHFDAGQAPWPAPMRGNTYRAWRAFATRDLTPEIMGLTGFAAWVDQRPEGAREALHWALDRLEVPAAARETLCHRALMTLGGWAQLGRWRRWQAELAGGDDTTLRDLLAVRLLWDAALLEHYDTAITDAWQQTLAAHAQAVRPATHHRVDALLQAAAERAAQRRLTAELAAAEPPAEPAPSLQAVFCIDVRSEVFRRALESCDAGIQTLGFAGFFGLPLAHRRFASTLEEARLPVLLAPSLHSAPAAPAAAEEQARITARAHRAWHRFKLAAVASFAFVEAAGPLYGLRLLRDALGLKARPRATEPAPELVDGTAQAARVELAEGILRAMSLTEGFAPWVLLVGHGATVVNNPHASALQCGACGGQSGEVNARLLAALLNAPEVRSGLAERGIEIPATTRFLAGLHDTTTDRLEVFSADLPEATLPASLRGWLGQAGRIARAERARRLPRADSGAGLARRSRDWAEVRPEWGLAGCKAFIAAPRRVSAAVALDGQAFLHDYDWRGDRGFAVLETLLTAPVVVASWISLQYYGSAVAPAAFGAGSKLLHNVVGGVGVLEGNGGPLRGGLPWQSVHDGERLVHDPLRLTVMVQAPCEAIAEVLSRHASVRTLFDRGWLQLLVLDEQGQPAWRYRAGLDWHPLDAPAEPSAGLAARA